MRDDDGCHRWYRSRGQVDFVSTDDFGTAYSSLLYLRQFPINVFELDRAFVAGITANEVDRAIVGSTIDLAHSLRMLAIAEGVETHEQLVVLRELGCDFAPGFYWSRPVPAGPDLVAIFEERAAAFADQVRADPQ